MNKKHSIFIAFGFALLAAGTTLSCGQGTPTNATLGDSTSTTITPTETIAYVNLDTLQVHYDLFKDVQDRLEAMSQKAQSDLQSRSMAFQREIAEYQQNAPTMSAADRQSTEERLARKQDELAQYQQNAMESLANEEAEENQNLYNQITQYLEQHASEKGYNIVLSYSTGNPMVLYVDHNLEITQEVLTALNAKYAKEKE